MLFIGAVVMLRPVIVRLVRRQESRAELSQGAVAMVFLALLLSALATEWIGIHALFGAFLLGAMIPHDKLDQIRGRFVLKSFEVQRAAGRWQVLYDVSVEVEGQPKPALVAEWIGAGFL